MTKEELLTKTKIEIREIYYSEIRIDDNSYYCNNCNNCY